RLTYLGKAQVNGREADGLKVEKQGYPDVQLYFDAATGLLVKRQYQFEKERGRQVTREGFNSDHKTIQETKFPFRAVVLEDGQKRFASEILYLRYHDSLDAKLFARPQP